MILNLLDVCFAITQVRYKTLPVMPRRVPEVLAGIALRGAAKMPHVAGGTSRMLGICISYVGYL